ncbi:MAG: helix-turn-helix domain-containing protein [Myxococcota bacterium]
MVLSPEQLEELIERAVERALARHRPADSGGEWVDAAGAAQILQIHRQSINRLARRGDLPSARVGNRYRFRRRDVEALLEGKP